MAKAKANGQQTPEVVRTSAGLRDALFDEIDGLRNGTSDGRRANAVARIAGEIVNTVHMEIAVQRHLSGDQPHRKPTLPESVALGRGAGEAPLAGVELPPEPPKPPPSGKK
jgi:hypothetical protein